MPDPEAPDRPISIPYATGYRRRPSTVTWATLVGIALLVGGLIGMAWTRRVTVTVTMTPATPAAPATATAPAPVALWAAPPPPPPPVLNLPADPPRLTITQRTAEAIPGSADTVLIQINDITGGRVRLSVLTSDGRTLASKDVRPGDAVTFTLNGKDYVVVAAEFHLRLAHADRGEFVVRRAEDPPTGEERIGRLIAAARNSAVTVVVPGADGAASEVKPADEFLRDAWLLRRPHSKTPEDLIRQAAAAPGSASLAPHARFIDGREVPVDEWLAGELAKLK